MCGELTAALNSVPPVLFRVFSVTYRQIETLVPSKGPSVNEVSVRNVSRILFAKGLE